MEGRKAEIAARVEPLMLPTGTKQPPGCAGSVRIGCLELINPDLYARELCVSSSYWSWQIFHKRTFQKK